MTKIYIVLLSSFLCATNIFAQDASDTAPPALRAEFSYLCDQINNLQGGIKKGSVFLGMASLRLNFDTEKAHLWKGGNFFLHAANIHGKSPSENLLGDMQVASNIDAGNHTYVQELWYSQTIGNTELILGLQDLNAEFANTEYGSFYMNSSFGIMPLISNNLAAPIFPLTTLGFTVKWHINQKLTWLNALYDGCPSDFDTNPYNLSWKFSPGDGLLTVSELQYNLASDKLPGTYKLGIFTHNHILEQTLGIDIPQAKESSVLGFYAHADQILWHKDDRFFALFAQLGYSPTPDCVNNYYFGLGLNYQGIFSPPGKDMLGIAIAHERLCEFETAETTWEFSYRYDFSAHFFVQPNLIHIVHPLGTGEVLANSTSLNLRLGLSL